MILTTGVSGGVGNLILRGLSGIEGVDVVAGSRAGDGRATRRVDFDDPASLPEAFRGVDVLLLVSAGYAEDDVVFARHGAVAEFVIERRVVDQMDDVTLVVEPAGPSFSSERLEADLRQALGVRLQCRVVAPGSLPRAEMKSKRVVRL